VRHCEETLRYDVRENRLAILRDQSNTLIVEINDRALCIPATAGPQVSFETRRRGSASGSLVADVCVVIDRSLIKGTIVSKLQRMRCLATKVIGIKRRVISETMRFA